MAAIVRLISACTVLLWLASCATTAAGVDERRTESTCHLKYPEAHAAESGAPPKEMVVAAMQSVKSNVMRCYDHYHQRGMVVTCLDVAADGTVESVDSEGDLVGSDQAQCIKTAVQSAKFAPHDAPWSFRYPYVFQ